MKEKIFMFIIGLLVGAILATGGFYIYQKNNKADNSNVENTTSTEQQDKMKGGPGGRMSGDFNGEEPPARPDEDSDSANTNSSEPQSSDSEEQEV